MQKNSLSVSIVIPVYNEAPELGACLEAIARQSVLPYEVIMVDNNSSDKTVEIAKQYQFVTILKEPRQGVVHARARGFDAARGAIIARIDGDSIVPNDWVASIQRVFSDQSVDAASGVAHYYNVAYAELFNAIDLFFRRRLERQLAGNVFLWGANMAVRRSAWRMVKPHLCNRGGMHEDYDIAIHLQQQGGTVVFDEQMHAQVSSRRIEVNYISFMKYVLVSPNTYAQHGIRERWHMYEVAAVCAIGYMPARILHRGYDPDLARFSFRYLCTPRQIVPTRVDPTSNVA